jgi:ABC-type proline/glycine betaine transport system ATPase subunit
VIIDGDKVVQIGAPQEIISNPPMTTYERSSKESTPAVT